MTKKLKKEAAAAKLAKDDPWYKFWQASLVLDKGDPNKVGAEKGEKPYGWHWFWGIYHLHNEIDTFPRFNSEIIQIALPDGHKFKKEKSHIATKYDIFKGQKILTNLKERLIEIKDPKEITKIDFSGVEFEDDIDFSNLIFPIETDFSNTKFLKDVLFTDAIFIETADFENAKFHEEPVTHKETAKFKNTLFNKVANFNKAIFNAYANFKEATFRGRTIFQQAKFKYHAPRFYGATFNNELILNRIELPEAKKDENNTNDTDADLYEKRIEENKSAYETLIYLMEKQNKYHDKHRFFREEMRWRQLGNILTKERRIKETQKNPPIEYPCFLRIEHNFTIIFFCIYDKVADYGYGIGRALAWWLVHILFGMLVIAIMIIIDSAVGCWQHRGLELVKSLSCAISVSFANANPYAFFGFDSIGLKGCYARLDMLMPIGFAIVKVIQTIIGVSLLFLLLTTLRVRFRLGDTASNTTINTTSEK